MDRLTQQYPVLLRWRSFELRPADAPPLPPEFRARIEAARPRLITMAQQQYGLEINSGPFGINSRAALVGAKFAEAQGKGEVYHSAVFRAYWQETKDINNRQVLAETAVSVGLEREPFLAALDDTEFDGLVTADVLQAHRYGLNGVPALIFADKYLVSGAQPYPVLQQITEQILQTME